MHLPLSMSVAATGAGMVSLIEHAKDHQTPVATAWLIGGATAVLCGSLSVIVALVPQRPGAKLVGYSLVAAARAALAAAAVHPRPWVLAAVLVAVLSIVWFEAFVRHAHSATPSFPMPSRPDGSPAGQGVQSARARRSAVPLRMRERRAKPPACGIDPGTGSLARLQPRVGAPIPHEERL
jgi:hypothetical protein